LPHRDLLANSAHLDSVIAIRIGPNFTDNTPQPAIFRLHVPYRNNPNTPKAVSLRNPNRWLRPFAAALVMGLFALTGAGGVMWVHQQTQERILSNQRQDELQAISRLLPENAYDHDLLAHPRHFAIQRNGRPAMPVTAYLAMRGERTVATLLRLTTPDGYNGDIELLLAVRANGSLAGVEVIAHRETPGLGDRIESGRSNWLKQFDNASLEHPDMAAWKVKRDGGSFDQLTGATVTPRAVVRVVRETLGYLRTHPIAATEMTAQSGYGDIAETGRQKPPAPAGG
jgi:Na+-translocating ferredoxin:NAD+ oxidoreductase subunit G